MDLWIRSQDKELLVKSKGFEFQKTYDGRYQIYAVWQTNYQMVGIYKNKERAIEVLDEIQNALTKSFIVNGLGECKAQSNITIYQMPKE